MDSIVLLMMAAMASGSPMPGATVPITSTATAAFYDLVGTASAVTPNSAPVFGISADVVVYDADSVAASVEAAVTGVATLLSKREALAVDANLCIVLLGIQIPPGCKSTTSSTTHYATTTSVTPATTAAATCKTETTALTTAAPTTTSTSVYVSIPSTCTPTDWVNSNTYTSVAACPTAIEVGTYCGFINPEVS